MSQFDTSHVYESGAREGLLMSSYMLVGANAAARLERAGSRVISYYDNGRRPVLIIDKPPQFVQGAKKARYPNGTGYTEIHAASYHGAQLEWMVDAPMRLEVMGA